MSAGAEADAPRRYTIVRKLAVGGMAELFLARITGLGGFEKYVAVKRLRPELIADPEMARMLLDEARLAAQLQHQNIGQVYDVGQAGRYLFSVRWEGDFDFATAGTYRFETRSDDGIRVFVDGGEILSLWTDHAATTLARDKALTAGSHRIKVEYYENGGDAVASVKWSLVSGSPPPPAPPPADSTGAVKLTKRATAVISSFAGQVIENLDLWVDSGDAVRITHANVKVRNMRIHHRTGDGINVNGASGVEISNCEIINSDPPAGFNGETSDTINNIEVYSSPDLRVTNVTLREGSTGIYIQRSPRAIVTDIDGYNFRGPFPRGQLAQFGTGSYDSKLSNFYVYCDIYNSRTEDNVNVYHSERVTIENGVVDGNNSPSGVGVLFEGASDGGVVRHVDVVHQSNGGFSSYSNNVDFFDVRVFDGYNVDIGRGKALSNGLSFGIVANGITFDDATWTRPANRNNIAWDVSRAEFLDIREDPGATVRAKNVNTWSWTY